MQHTRRHDALTQRQTHKVHTRTNTRDNTRTGFVVLKMALGEGGPVELVNPLGGLNEQSRGQV